MQEVVAQIEREAPLDPATRQALLADLERTPPELWTGLAQTFVATARYRQKIQAKQGASTPEASPGQQSALATDTQQAEPPVVGPFGSASQGGAPRVFSGPASQEQSGSGPTASDAPEPPGPGKTTQGATPDRAQARNGRVDPLVTPARYEPAEPEDWCGHVAQAIRALESAASGPARSDAELVRQVRLRLLHLALGERSDAVQAIVGLDRPMQEFWAKEFFGLSTLLDPELIADPTQRAAEAKRHLSEAVVRLGQCAQLEVRNVAFVSEVPSWGAYRPVEKYEFSPEQRVLLYAEVENLRSQQTPRGYFTAWRCSYQIFDSRGQRIAEYEFPVNEEYCQNLRRDFFIGCEFFLPKRIYPGKYVLQLTVADASSQKIGQASVEFTIKAAGE